MKWKNIPSWFKGGLFGIVAGFIIQIAILLLVGITAICSFAGVKQCADIFNKVLPIFLYPIQNLGLGYSQAYGELVIFIGFVFYIAIFFIIGALIGLISKKIKK